MLAADVTQVVDELIDVLRIALRSQAVRAHVAAEFVDLDVREIRKLRGREIVWTVQARVGCAEVVDEAAADAPRVREDRFACVGSLRSRELRLWLNGIHLRSAETVIQKASAQLVRAQIQVRVHSEVVLIGKSRSDACILADVDRNAVDEGGAALGRRCGKLLQDSGYRGVRIQSLELADTTCRGHGDGRTLGTQTFVLEFVGAVNEKLIPEDRAAYAGARTIVVEAVLDICGTRDEGRFFLIGGGVEIAIAVAPPARTVPIVGAGFGNDIELPAGGMPVLCAKLVGEQGELRNGLLDDRLRRAINVQPVVIDAIDGKSVESRTSTADGSTRTLHSALLGGGPRGEDREFLDVATQCIHR